MGDEYVSVEHLFLCLIKYPNKAMKEIFKEYGITRERFLQALSTVRGNQRVVSDNPEATYDTLEKYGYDIDVYKRQVSITVSDTGAGIADVSKAMEPFYTTKPELERSGMGFSRCV